MQVQIGIFVLEYLGHNPGEVDADAVGLNGGQLLLAALIDTFCVTLMPGSIAPLALALAGGSDTDPELDRSRNDLTASVTLQTRRVLKVFGNRGWIRTNVSFDELIETPAVLCSVKPYLRITHHDGWSAAVLLVLVIALGAPPQRSHRR